MDTIQSVADAVRDLADTVLISNQGMIAVVNSLAVHGEMLRQILAAVTEPAPDASPLTDLLAQLVEADQAHHALLVKIGGGVQRIETDVQSLRRR